MTCHCHCSYHLSLFIPLLIVHTTCHCSYHLWQVTSDKCWTVASGMNNDKCYEQWQLIWTMTCHCHCSYHLSLFILLTIVHTATSVEQWQVLNNDKWYEKLQVVWTMTSGMNNDMSLSLFIPLVIVHTTCHCSYHLQLTDISVEHWQVVWTTTSGMNNDKWYEHWQVVWTMANGMNNDKWYEQWLVIVIVHTTSHCSYSERC